MAVMNERHSPQIYRALANCIADNVEKVIWDNVSSETITINVVATGFAEPDPDEQSFAVAWDLRSE